MEKEYKGDQKCVECHMGPKVKKYAASIRLQNGKVRPKKIRVHTFLGAHKESLWKDALKLSIKNAKDNLHVTITNPTATQHSFGIWRKRTPFGGYVLQRNKKA